MKSLIDILKNHIISYATPDTLNMNWSFGSLLGLCLVVQIATGLFLTMHYTPEVSLAFLSIEHIMRDVNFGWFFRYAHANNASIFFMLIYVHMGRGLYFKSYLYPRMWVWYTGVVIFLLLMASAFLGYVLPWGQMSFWGATVITNLFTAIPGVGPAIAQWLWGGFSVQNATLNRFFCLHYLLPFVLAVVVVLHIYLLHKTGSTNPMGIDYMPNNVRFYPYFFFKDLAAFLVYLFVLFFIVCYFPNTLGHPDNYIKADPLVTPTHIVPEWYFLPFYAILRSIPDKLGGVIAMFASILILFLLPIIDPKLMGSTPRFSYFYSFIFWWFCALFICLGWLGAQPIEQPYLLVGQLCTAFYFVFFLAVIPAISFFENEAYKK